MKNNSPTTALYRVTDLCKEFHDGAQNLLILKKINLVISPNTTLAILGRSGSGKSTLLHILGLMDKPTSGTLEFFGQNLRSLAAREVDTMRSLKIGFVFQHFHLLPSLTVLENVMLPARIAGIQEARAREESLHLLDMVGLSDRQRHIPKKLSGGERQRTAIARALVNGPSLLLCDEPTGNLDHHTADQVISLLFKAVQSRGASMVIVTHDSAVAKLADRQMVLADAVLQAPY